MMDRQEWIPLEIDEGKPTKLGNFYEIPWKFCVASKMGQM